MFALFDVTNYQCIAKHESYKALACLAYIQYANVDCAIVRLDVNKGFSIFTKEQLIEVAKKMAVNGQWANLAVMSYGEIISVIRLFIDSAQYLLLPFPLAMLEDQAYEIDKSDDRPRYFNPKAFASTVAPMWANEPKTVKARRTDSTFAINFASGLHAGLKDEVIEQTPTVPTPKAKAPAPMPPQPKRK